MKRSRGQKYARSRGLIERLEDRILLAGDDTLATATEVLLTPSVASNLSDQISTGGEVDLYKVTLAFGDTLTANIDADVNGSSLDSLLRLFDSSGNELASNDDDGVTFDSLLTFQATAAGTYYVGVSGSDNPFYNPNVADSGFGGSSGNYSLSLLETPLTDAGDTLATAVNEPLVPSAPATQIPGQIDPLGDVDLYQVTMAEGETLTADIDAAVNGSSLDSYLRVFDAAGNELAQNDDDGSGGTDSLIQFTAPTSGTFYVGVSDFGNPLYDANTAGSGSGAVTGDYTLKLSLAPATSPVPDNNDTLATAVPVGFVRDVESSIGGKIATDTDVDLYKASLVAGDTLHLNADAQVNSSPLDARVRLFDAAGNEIASNDNTNGLDPEIDFSITTTGTYFVGVSGAANSAYDPTVADSGVAASKGDYQLRIKVESAPAVTAEVEPNNSIATPNVIAVGTTVSGNISTASDADVYMFTVGQNGLLTAQIAQSSGSQLDSRMTLLTSDGTTLFTSDDQAIGNVNPLIVLHVAPGSYFLKIEASPGAAATEVGGYQLTTSFLESGSPFDPKPTGQFPEIIAAGDFNGDGKLDLVTADHATFGVSVLLGVGDYSFRPAMSVDVGAQPGAVTVGDFNHDGKLDIAVATAFVDTSAPPQIVDGNVEFTTTVTVTVLLGVGDGTFTAATPSVLGTYLSMNGNEPLSLTAADFNIDGKIDLAVSSSGLAAVNVLQGQGDGSFVVGSTVNLAGGPAEIVAGDFNGDGRADLATANADSNSVSILLNNGSGGFSTHTEISVGTTPSSLVAAKFNADGFLDLAVANAGSDDISLLFGNGNGTFQPESRTVIRDVPPLLGSTRSFVTAADINHDGVQDLIVGQLSDARISVALGNGDGTFQRRKEFVGDPSSQPWSAVVGDFNGDGRMDFATADSQVGHASVFGGLDDGTFLSGSQLFIGNEPRGLIVADFNHDGHLDLVSANANDASVLLGQGGGSFQEQLRADAGMPNALAYGDFNHDGNLDIAAADHDPDTGVSTVVILLGLGDGTYLAQDPITVGLFLSAVVVGDFNGDGNLDVAVTSQFQSSVIVLLGDGNGGFAPQAPISVGSQPAGLAVGDFNHDGKLDLATANSGSNDVTVLLGNGDGTFNALTPLAVGDQPVAIVAGQFDGVGGDDLAVADSGNGRVTVLLGGDLNDFTSSPPLDLSVGDQPSSLVAGDFNGDHVLDLAVANYGSDDVSVLLNSGSGAFGIQSRFSLKTGASTVQPKAIAVGDFNDDGFVDLATANGFSRDVSILNGNGDGSFNLPGQQSSAAVNSAPILADLNGDGVADSVTMDRAGNVLLRLGRSDIKGTFQAPLVVNPNTPATSFAVLKDGKNSVLAVAARAGTHGTLYRFTKSGMPVVVAPFDLADPNSPAAAQHFDRIVSAKLNGDNRDDLVAIDSTHGTLALFLRSGNSFDVVHAVRTHVAIAASDLVTANLDGSGGIDVVVADEKSGTVNIVLGGFAALQSPVDYRASAGPTANLQVFDGALSVATGDFNEDHIQDVVVAHQGTNSLGLLLGKGNGALVNAQDILAGSKPIAIRVGDFNHDHHLDLAVLNAGSDDVSIFLGDGHGHFTPGGKFAVGDSPTGLSVADVNGDGKLDLLVSNDFGDVLNLVGNGNGTFKAFARINRNMAIALSDLDGDGKPDWVVTNEAGDRVTVQKSSQTPVFDRNSGVMAPAGVKLADLNGDTIPDMIVANRGGNEVLVYVGLGDGQFAPAKSFYAGTDPVDVQVADVNGDGKPDVIVTNFGSNDVRVRFGTGDASLLKQENLRIDVGQGPTATQVGDFQSNGKQDLLVTNSVSNQVMMFTGQGTGFFNNNPTVFNTGAGPTQALVGNFDGQMGFVTTNYNSNTLTFYSGFDPLARRDISSGGQNPLTAIAADMNQDGLTDLVVGNNGDGVFSVFNGGPSGLSLLNAFASENVDHPAALALAQIGQGQELQLLALDEGDELVHVFSRESLESTRDSSALTALAQDSSSAFSGLFGGTTSGFGIFVSLVAGLGVAVEGFLQPAGETRGLDGGAEASRAVSDFFEHLGEAISHGKQLFETTVKGFSTAVGVEMDDQTIVHAVEDVVSLLFPHVPLQAVPALFHGLLSGPTTQKKTSPTSVDHALEDRGPSSWITDPTAALNMYVEAMKQQGQADRALQSAIFRPDQILPITDIQAVAAKSVEQTSSDGKRLDGEFDQQQLGLNLQLLRQVEREAYFEQTDTHNHHRRATALAAVMASIGAGGVIYRLRRRRENT